MNNNITAGLILVSLLTTASAFAQNDNAKSNKHLTGDPVAGKDKSRLCQGCHGEDGNSLVTLIPKIAGQDIAYISWQIHNFQAGIRTHQVMNDLATTVNDEDLADIAAYFASRNKMKGGNSAADNKIGRDLFLNGDTHRMIDACVNCHGKNGKGLEPNPSMFPVIGGQHKDYLHRQLINFKAGGRSNSPNGVMNVITKSLTDAELESLAEYISGQ